MKPVSTPLSVDIAITSQCNLRCRYCSHFTGASDTGQDLAKEEWLDFFEELNRCKVLNVVLQGGEPFLRKDLKMLIDGIVRNRMRFAILSNGTLITEGMAAFLASTRRCDNVQVSIDGSTPTSHDAFRGKGNFFKTIKGIEYLQKHCVPVSVRVTIHRKNVNDLNGIARLLLEDIGLDGFSTNSASHMGLCRQNAEQVQLTTEERTLAMATLVKLNEQYSGRISATAGPLAEAKTWRLMEEAHGGKKAFIPGGGFLTGCSGPMDNIAVRSDGIMTPCSQLGHIELGRINVHDLKEVWQNHPDLKRLRERHHIALSRFEFCRACEYMNYCTGNCPALAYTLEGDENHPSPDACFKRFLAKGGRLP